jgi:large subunit ribosomal protein L32e
MAEEKEEVKERGEEKEFPKKKTDTPKKKPVKPEEKETETKEKEDVKTPAPPKKTRVRKVKKETPKPESEKEEKKEEEPSKEKMKEKKGEEDKKAPAPPKKTQVRKVKKGTPKPESKKEEKKEEGPSEEEMEDEKKEEIEIVEEEAETEYKVKIKPKLSKELKHDLMVRKTIKNKTPHFRQQEWFRYKRINESWRRPRGMHSKMRKHKGYRQNVVSVGYGSPKKTRNLHPSGFQEIMVYNTKDLEKINPKSQAARVGHSVGTRKRIEIEKQAEKKGIRVLNPRRL